MERKTGITRFEGIMLIGDIWVNGQKVGSTDYGYIGFKRILLNY